MQSFSARPGFRNWCLCHTFNSVVRDFSYLFWLLFVKPPFTASLQLAQQYPPSGRICLFTPTDVSAARTSSPLAVLFQATPLRCFNSHPPASRSDKIRDYHD